ncbi:MAG: phosphate ABC transporter permease PstA [gamma proteobacterium symbiont of Bathyaustriella thionipta]|nr:phosphate ABC transporter permease PstA [gamma proteobacterium symbiont of Bathyaustriella thionipta]MCU7951042.1 phosphate ABC transporter permease PstA [gamma proteobacterium symbiont of Bathyaustriella thionipta]MCU7951979.1 phosphate ABC transporter permease PstA [gamma proteobacterium symbiont of Bathyaustriella thionipta]MCU7957554.1 phosphate ABC transporter permease PstA [gamma proteobacterium symbiont of Bathyaustriella thionipta]MCU7967645.1 phosphate ABC transporter permease PstA 
MKNINNKTLSDNPFYDPSLSKRHSKARRFKIFTITCIVFALSFLVFFLGDMIVKGLPAFQQSYMQIDVSYNDKTIASTRKAIDKKYRRIVSRAWLRNIPNQVEESPELMNTTQSTWVLVNHQVDQYMKGHYFKIKSKELKIIEDMHAQGKLQLQFNRIFFTQGDSKIPENSGLKSAIIGSILTLLVTMVVAFPMGVMTAVYLEEFADDNRWTQFIEVNINNLAAIPSILFGLLGLAVFINLFGLPRSSPLVGGLTLALMTLPIIIVSSRAALRSVPDSIRQAGYGLGLTKVQVVQDHVLPLAFPGIMTGSIIGLAHAMGETAPLIIIGMIAFIPDSPGSIFEAATVMPAQIFTWAGMPERAYIERTAAGIMVLLSVLISLNALAIILRKKFEVKW